ncbi:MAG: glycosyltransferase family 39 protein [Croceibacterium sp.]
MLRIGVRLAHGTGTYWADGYTQYKALADSLAAGHGYAFPGQPPTAFRVPLYPLFIAATTGGNANPWLLITAQAVVSSVLVILTGLLARRLYGPAAGLLAATWCAIYPYYAWHDLSLQESGLFAALTALATLLLFAARDHRRPMLAVTAGAALGAAILTRAVLAPFAMLAVAWLMVPDGHNWRRRLTSAGLVLGAMSLTLAPWLTRAHALTGGSNLGTEFGQSVYAGASPLLFGAFPEESVDVSRRIIFTAMSPADMHSLSQAAGIGPAAESDWYARCALDMALADRTGYAARAVRKLAIAFGPRPAPHHGMVADTAYALCWLPLLTLGMLGLWRDRANWRRTSLLVAHLAAFSAVTALVWAQTAHRAYLDLYLMVLASPVLLGWLPPRARLALAR